MESVEYRRGFEFSYAYAVTLPQSAWTMNVVVENILDRSAPVPGGFVCTTNEVGVNAADPSMYDYVFTAIASHDVTAGWPRNADGSPIDFVAFIGLTDSNGWKIFSPSFLLRALS